jgi:hypothetical protein
MPSVFAVLRLITNSNFVTSMTQIIRLCALENAARIIPGLPIGIWQIDAVAYEPAGYGVLTKLVYRRDAVLRGECYNLVALRVKERISRDHECGNMLTYNGLERLSNRSGGTGAQHIKTELKRPGGRLKLAELVLRRRKIGIEQHVDRFGTRNHFMQETKPFCFQAAGHDMNASGIAARPIEARHYP